MSGQHSAGKGSKYRKVGLEQYNKNWEKCFGNKKKKVVNKTKKEKYNGEKENGN